MQETRIISRHHISTHTASCLYTEAFSFQANEKVPEHGHEFFEIGITLAGNATHETKIHKYTLTPGCVYCIPMGTTHAITADSLWSVYNIYLFPTSFTSCFLGNNSSPYHLLRYFLIKICGRQPDILHFRLSETTLQTIHTNFRLIKDHPFPDSDSFSLYREHCILNILLLLAEEYALQFGIQSQPYDSRLIEITQYILIHLEQPTRQLLSSLVERLSLNEQYLNRIVKKEIGLPISQYIHQCKIEKGIQLLYSGQSIAETAYSLGFYDQSHFYKYFLKYVKMSPKDFKKKISL